MTFTHWIFLLFIVVIILTLSFRKPPILAAVIGVFGVGLADSKEVIGALQIAFRALILATSNLLSIILLIGIVVALTQLLKDTKADQLIVKPLLNIKNENLAFWIVGLTMYILTLLVWPTPAITLLGAVVIPSLAKVGLNPLGLAVSLTLFGKGFGLAGDFIIQGAPSIVGKASGIPVNLILSTSMPIVIISGALAALTGWLLLKLKPLQSPQNLEKEKSPSKNTNNLTSINANTSPNLNLNLNLNLNTNTDTKPNSNRNINQKNSHKSTNKAESKDNPKNKDKDKDKDIHKDIDKNLENKMSPKRIRTLAILVSVSYSLAVFFILIFSIRSDAASALIGGVSLLCISVGSIIKDGRGAFQSFIDYLKEGFKFSIGVFTPIVVMSSFFMLGTEAGYREILGREGLGFLSDYAYTLSEIIPLSKWTVGLIMILVAILGSMDGSGFAGLPLVGGVAVALGEATNLPVIPLAVLGQIVGVWTGGVLVPWGFVAVIGAVTGVKVNQMFRFNIPAFMVAIGSTFIWAMLNL